MDTLLLGLALGALALAMFRVGIWALIGE